MSYGFLLDTNIPSELAKPLPEARVANWLAKQESFYMSVVTIGELRKGFSLLPSGKRRTDLEAWFDRLLPTVAERVLPVTQAIASRWGELSAARQLQGAPLSLSDGLIAATALEHDLALVTRNVKDFVGLGLELINPWEL